LVCVIPNMVSNQLEYRKQATFFLQIPPFLFMSEYFAHIRIFMAKGRAPLNSLRMSWHGHR